MGTDISSTKPAWLPSFGSPVTARRSRLAGHGSPIFIKTTDAGVGFSKFSSPFTVAAFIPYRAGPAFAESASPSNSAGGYFAVSGMELPKSAASFAKSAMGFAAAGSGFTKSAEAFAKSARPLPVSEAAFPQQFADKSPVFPASFPFPPQTINH